MSDHTIVISWSWRSFLYSSSVYCHLFLISSASVSYHEFYCCSSFFWRRQWRPTPVLLPRKSHGWRGLVGCSPWGRKESDTTERLHFIFSLLCIGERNGNPLQCSCLEYPRDRGAWWAAVYEVAQSWTWLKRLSSSSSSLLKKISTGLPKILTFISHKQSSSSFHHPFFFFLLWNFLLFKILTDNNQRTTIFVCPQDLPLYSYMTWGKSIPLCFNFFIYKIY